MRAYKSVPDLNNLEMEWGKLKPAVLPSETAVGTLSRLSLKSSFTISLVKWFTTKPTACPQNFMMEISLGLCRELFKLPRLTAVGVPANDLPKSRRVTVP